MGVVQHHAAKTNPSRVDDVLYRLRAIVMSARSDGLVKANEEFAAWMLGERSMPFGADGQHVTIRLIDFDDIERNSFVVTQQFTFRAGKTEKRADLVLLVNGLPLVLIEAKTPIRSSQSWLDAALQVHDDYEQNVCLLISGAHGGRMPMDRNRWARSRSPSTPCCGRPWCWTCSPTSPPLRPRRASSASRSSPATSRSTASTRSSSVSSPPRCARG
jgi:type I site-specific restriction-modification system R (restriction) subunit